MVVHENKKKVHMLRLKKKKHFKIDKKGTLEIYINFLGTIVMVVYENKK